MTTSGRSQSGEQLPVAGSIVEHDPTLYDLAPLAGDRRDARRDGGRRWVVIGLLVAGSAASAGVLLVSKIATCDPFAPIMSINGGREMPQPYATWSVIVNAIAPILLATAVALTAKRLRPLVWIGTWLVTGLALYVASEAVWQNTCPT